MAKVNIFVSHRIDVDSYIVESEIYKPIRCGAIFDKENRRGIPGDDTGENISNLRTLLCEFTVQYWAWKNVDADYYGLCHYRRYLSFSDKRYRKKYYENAVIEPFLNARSQNKYGLNRTKEIEMNVQLYDLIISEGIHMSDVSRYTSVPINNVYEWWMVKLGDFFDLSSFNTFIDVLMEYNPELYHSANAYLKGNIHRGYNCFIARKEIFNELCSFEFSILKILFDKIPKEKLKIYPRMMAYFGEILYGIYVDWIIKTKKYKVAEKQLVYFEETKVFSNNIKLMARIKIAKAYITKEITPYFFPYYSKRRQFIKKLI